jgi:hypothetical protein
LRREENATDRAPLGKWKMKNSSSLWAWARRLRARKTFISQFVSEFGGGGVAH